VTQQDLSSSRNPQRSEKSSGFRLSVDCLSAIRQSIMIVVDSIAALRLGWFEAGGKNKILRACWRRE